jgi:hypothetical protein
MVRLNANVDNINVKLDSNNEKIYRCNKKCNRFLHHHYFPKNSLSCYDCKKEYNRTYMRLKRIAEAQHTFTKEGYKILILDNISNKRENEELKEEKIVITSQNQELKQEKIVITSQNEELKQENAIILSQNEELKVKINRMLEENNKVTSQNEELKQENAIILSENEELKVKINRMLEENNKVISQNEELKEENKIIISQNEELMEKINRMVEENNNITLKNEELMEQINRMVEENNNNTLKNKTTTEELNMMMERMQMQNEEFQQKNEEREKNFIFVSQQNKVLKYKLVLIEEKEKFVNEELQRVYDERARMNLDAFALRYPNGLNYGMERDVKYELSKILTFHKTKTRDKRFQDREMLLLYTMENMDKENMLDQGKDKNLLEKALELNDNLIHLLSQTKDLDKIVVENSIVREHIKEVKNLPKSKINEEDEKFIDDILNGRYKDKIVKEVLNLGEIYNTQSFFYTALYDKCTTQERNRADAFIKKYNIETDETYMSALENLMEDRENKEYQAKVLDRKINDQKYWNNMKAAWENTIIDCNMLSEADDPVTGHLNYVLINPKDGLRKFYNFALEPQITREKMRRIKPIRDI